MYKKALETGVSLCRGPLRNVKGSVYREFKEIVGGLVKGSISLCVSSVRGNLEEGSLSVDPIGYGRRAWE